MKTSINLATPEKSNKNKRLFLLFSIAFFGLCFVMAMILLSYSLFLNNEYSNLTGQEGTLRYNLNAISQKKIQYLTVRERLIDIQKILNTRKNINTHLVSVINLFPSGVEISTFSVSDTSVSLTASSKNLSKLNNLLKTNIPRFTQDPRNHIEKVEQSSLDFNPNDLTYNVSLDFTFK